MLRPLSSLQRSREIPLGQYQLWVMERHSFTSGFLPASAPSPCSRLNSGRSGLAWSLASRFLSTSTLTSTSPLQPTPSRSPGRGKRVAVKLAGLLWKALMMKPSLSDSWELYFSGLQFPYSSPEWVEGVAVRAGQGLWGGAEPWLPLFTVSVTLDKFLSFSASVSSSVKWGTIVSTSR